MTHEEAQRDSNPPLVALRTALQAPKEQLDKAVAKLEPSEVSRLLKAVSKHERLRAATDLVEASDRISLAFALLDRMGATPIESAVQGLEEEDQAKVYKATIRALDSDTIYEAWDGLDAGSRRKLIRAIARSDPAELLEKARDALNGAKNAVWDDLAIETDDVLRRVRAADAPWSPS